MRLREPSAEVPQHREDRLGRHEPADVVVIGGGLAGISAAIEASRARARVVLLDKEADLGGNSAKATSGINACGTVFFAFLFFCLSISGEGRLRHR